MDFRRETAARTAERLVVLPPFAPAAETCARTTVESNICTRCAVSLIAASASKETGLGVLLVPGKRLKVWRDLRAEGPSCGLVGATD